MKTVCPPVYHLNGIAATHALGHMGHLTGRAHVFMIAYIYVYIYIYIYIFMYIHIQIITVITALLENDADVVFASFTYF